MDLNLYLEQNIVDYLNKKEAERDMMKARQKREEEHNELQVDKDYEDLLSKAIQAGEFNKAKDLFYEANDKLGQAKTEKEKELYTDLLDKLFFMLREHDSLKREIREMIQNKEREHALSKERKRTEKKEEPRISDQIVENQNVDLIEQGSPKEQTIINDAKTTFATPQVQSTTTQKVTPTSQTTKNMSDAEVEEMVVEVKKDMANSNKKIAEHLEKSNFKAAMQEYKHMKQRFDEVPDTAKGKKDLFEDLISCYNQIKKLEHFVTKELTDEIKKTKEKRKAMYDESKEQVLIASKKIKVFLGEQQFKNAMVEYNEIKKIYDYYPFEYKAERRIFYKQLITVYKKIKEVIEETYHKKIFKERTSIKALEKEENPEIRKEREIFHIMVKLKEDVKTIIELMKESELQKARLKLLDVKHEVELLPDEKKGEKLKFEHIIEEIGHRMNFLEQTTEMVKQNA